MKIIIMKMEHELKKGMRNLQEGEGDKRRYRQVEKLEVYYMYSMKIA
jgi:hypothetical protein